MNIKKILQWCGVMIFGVALIMLAAFLMCMPDKHKARVELVPIQSPQQMLVLKHRTEVIHDMKNPARFSISKSRVYFEGTAIISCLEFEANDKDWHSVLIKRKTKNVYHKTDAAWSKYCEKRTTDDFTSYLVENGK